MIEVLFWLIRLYYILDLPHTPHKELSCRGRRLGDPNHLMNNEWWIMNNEKWIIEEDFLRAARDPSIRLFSRCHSWAKRRISRKKAPLEDDTGGARKSIYWKRRERAPALWRKFYCFGVGEDIILLKRTPKKSLTSITRRTLKLAFSAGESLA